ncbi:hypothetical protein Nepgr_026512 [Nepenthes gracilis]|uniref:Uncharacterized protein n=1 Tax=Nepenthes gracilis TaxID=150966 RepID=A0AAD3T8J8_NEPGR|nr:hypothetical protein Nepgr_026512 [Nepenthes gracilis]
MEMLATSQPRFLSSSHPHDYFDNYYDNDTYSEEPSNNQVREVVGKAIEETSIIPCFASETHLAQKLEDFLDGNTTTPSSVVLYSENSQRETQDYLSLTHIDDHQSSSATHFNDQPQDLEAITAAAAAPPFQALSTDSGSEVDDSALAGRATKTQLACSDFVSQSLDQLQSEFDLPQWGTGRLSLRFMESAEKATACDACSMVASGNRRHKGRIPAQTVTCPSYTHCSSQSALE